MISFKNIAILNALFLIPFYTQSCGKTHRSITEIYESGELGDTDAWVMSKYYDPDHDTLRYKYDTTLLAIKSFWTKDKKELSSIGFWRKNKLEGLSSFFQKGTGKKFGTIHYKNGKEDGFFTNYYENNQIQCKSYFRQGVEIYIVTYKENGEKTDSICLVK